VRASHAGRTWIDIQRIIHYFNRAKTHKKLRFPFTGPGLEAAVKVKESFYQNTAKRKNNIILCHEKQEKTYTEILLRGAV